MARSIEDFRSFLAGRLTDKTQKAAQEGPHSHIHELLNTERAELDMVLGVFNLMYPPPPEIQKKERRSSGARGLARKKSPKPH